MGNKGSTEYGGIFVQTTKSFYFPGELVQGIINLNITKLGFPGRRVCITITGKEILHRALDIGESSDDEWQTSTDTSYQVFRKNIVVYEFQQPTIPVGQFTTTFSFQLPLNIPGSFNQTHFSGAFERIIYKVKGQVIACKGYKNMSHIQQFSIREPLYEEQQLIGDGKVSDKGFCCRQKGVFIQYMQSVQITAITDRNVYRIGEAIRILIEIDDDKSIEKPKSIIIALENEVNFKYKRYDSNDKNIIQEQRIDTRTKKLGSYKVLNQQEVILFVQHKNHNNNDIHNLLQPTTNGKLINNQYRVLVKAEFGSSCTTYSECIELPIQVLSNSIIQIPQIQPPVGWKPIQLNDEQLHMLSTSKISSNSLHSYSTQQKTIQDRNSYNEVQGSQRSIRQGNSLHESQRSIKQPQGSVRSIRQEFEQQGSSRSIRNGSRVQEINFTMN